MIPRHPALTPHGVYYVAVDSNDSVWWETMSPMMSECKEITVQESAYDCWEDFELRGGRMERIAWRMVSVEHDYAKGESRTVEQFTAIEDGTWVINGVTVHLKAGQSITLDKLAKAFDTPTEGNGDGNLS